MYYCLGQFGQYSLYMCVYLGHILCICGLLQKRCNSSADALELSLFCINPTICAIEFRIEIWIESQWY